MLVTDRHRLNIGEFAYLLGKIGRTCDSWILVIGLSEIPRARTNQEYLSELLGLTKLRRSCYDIAKDCPELKEFLERQALMHAETPV